ncbi:MAG: hypothetical protein IT193_20250 [Propionibacteriaceae bacterium]|nr:hypothetical protein [Propionibacteriaceae bacterium]
MEADRRSVLTWLAAAMLGAALLVERRLPGVTYAQAPNVAAPTGTQGGRYQIIFNPSGIRADTFLLDTQTGKIWRPTKYTDLRGEPTAWVYEDRLDTITQVQGFAAAYGKPE